MIYAILGFSVFVNIFLMIVLIFVIRRALEAQSQLGDIEKQIDDSIDMLDRSYRSISHTLSIPVTSDEPFIKNIVVDIKQARKAVLAVANKLNRTFDIVDEESEI